MRKILIVIAIFETFSVRAQEQVFYYHNNEKIYLDKIENSKVIHFEKAVDSLQKENILSQLRASDYTIAEITLFMYNLSGNLIQFENDPVISTAKQNGNILYINWVITSNNSIPHIGNTGDSLLLTFTLSIPDTNLLPFYPHVKPYKQ